MKKFFLFVFTALVSISMPITVVNAKVLRKPKTAAQPLATEKGDLTTKTIIKKLPIGLEKYNNYTLGISMGIPKGWYEKPEELRQASRIKSAQGKLLIQFLPSETSTVDLLNFDIEMRLNQKIDAKNLDSIFIKDTGFDFMKNKARKDAPLLFQIGNPTVAQSDTLISGLPGRLYSVTVTLKNSDPVIHQFAYVPFQDRLYILHLAFPESIGEKDREVLISIFDSVKITTSSIAEKIAPTANTASRTRRLPSW